MWMWVACAAVYNAAVHSCISCYSHCTNPISELTFRRVSSSYRISGLLTRHAWRHLWVTWSAAAAAGSSSFRSAVERASACAQCQLGVDWMVAAGAAQRHFAGQYLSSFVIIIVVVSSSPIADSRRIPTHSITLVHSFQRGRCASVSVMLLIYWHALTPQIFFHVIVFLLIAMKQPTIGGDSSLHRFYNMCRTAISQLFGRYRNYYYYFIIIIISIIIMNVKCQHCYVTMEKTYTCLW